MDAAGKFFKAFWVLAIILAATFALATMSGCNTASKTYDATTGKKTSSVSQDDAVTANLANMFEKCQAARVEEPAEKKIEDAMIDTNCEGLTGATAQNTCVNGKINQGNLMMLGIIMNKVLDNNAKYKPTCQEQAAAVAIAYFGKESAQAKAWGSTGLALAIAVPTAWVIGQGIKTLETLGTDSGDTITTGNITATKSDDPIGGEGSTNGDIGSQAITIGSGQAVTDQGQIATDVDKNMDASFTRSDSNLDGSGSPSGIVIDDQNDGSGNEGSLF